MLPAIVTVVALLLTSTARATPSLERSPTRLLGDRFFMQLPIGMRVVANPRDASGLALPRWASTRAEIEREHPLLPVAAPGNWRARLVMVAWDTYAHARGNLWTGVRADVDRQGGAISEAFVRDLKFPASNLPRPRAISVDPPLPRRANDPNLIHAVYAADPDDNVVVIAFYAFGNALDEIDEWARLARAVTSTLELGNSDLSGRLGTSFLSLDGHGIEIPTPIGWTVAVAQVVEVGAAWIHARVPLGHGPASCTVDQSISNAPPTTQRERWRVLDTDGLWLTWFAHKRRFGEIVIAPRGRPRIRIACEAASPDELRELLRVAAQMRFKSS